jgi:acetolactate synthase-1/2/3 large subunit
LQTVAHYHLPIKIFVLNNNGYLSIRATQENFFGLMVGEGPGSGVSLPSYVALAQAYGIPAARLDKHNYRIGIRGVLDSAGPMLAEVMVDPAQRFEPRVAARRRQDGSIYSPGLEDMWPNLPPEELARHMLPRDTEDETTVKSLRRLAEAVPSPPVALTGGGGEPVVEPGEMVAR